MPQFFPNEYKSFLFLWKDNDDGTLPYNEEEEDRVIEAAKEVVNHAFCYELDGDYETTVYHEDAKPHSAYLVVRFKQPILNIFKVRRFMERIDSALIYISADGTLVVI